MAEKSRMSDTAVKAMALVHDNPLRHIFGNLIKTLKAAGIRPRQRVLEPGCGSGFFTIPGAKPERAPIVSEAPVQTSPINGVSIIIPAYNAEHTLRECLQAATTLKWSGDLEIIVVNDGSTDSTSEIASSFSGVKFIDVPHGGVALATNIGIRAARYNIVVLLDADAILESEWLEKIISSFDDPTVAVASGYVVTANRSIIGKIMGYDMESRLDRVPMDSDHLLTMNAACRRNVLLEIGLFNKELHAGQDVDLSRRLKVAGYHLILRKDVRCRHYWKDDLRGYLRQQYNYAYYRMVLAQRFGKPHDQVTGLGMILQVPLTIALFLAACLGSLVSPLTLLLFLLLPFIHLPKAFSLLISKRDACVLLLPLLFTIRNLCWVWAAMSWGIRGVTKSKTTL